MRKPLLVFPLLATLLAVPTPAHAVSKEIIQLQTQVQQLADMLQHLQQADDERLGVLQHLVEQSADSVNRMSQQLTTLQAQVEQSSKNDTLAGQIQGLNDSVDELKTRMGLVNKQLTDIESQLQNVQSQAAPAVSTPLSPAPQGFNTSPGLNSSSRNSSDTTATTIAPPAVPGVDPPLGPGNIANYTGTRGGVLANGVQAPPVDSLYQGALRDYNGARYDLATSEFADVVKYYPQNSLAGSSSYYLGEIAYRQGHYPAAIRYYDMVLEQFAGSSKSAAAQLRKAQAELASQHRDAGIRDLRSLVQRYPTSPEGAQGRSLLNGMGVRIVANKPAAGR